MVGDRKQSIDFDIKFYFSRKESQFIRFMLYRNLQMKQDVVYNCILRIENDDFGAIIII